MRIFLILIVTLLLAAIAQADVYRWVDSDGNVIFSDTERPGAEKVEIRETMTIPAFRQRPRTDRGSKAPKPQSYKSIEISRPPDAETIRDSTGNVAVAVQIDPKLQVQFGHALQLMLDGAVYGESGSATSFNLVDVDRGTHTLQIRVLGATGEVIAQSANSTFFLHRQSIQHR